MLSNLDTQVTGHRAYFEDCAIHGTVDFICGGGDNFYWHTDLVLENRGGNCITAPSTNSSQKWGYVFQECTIKAVDATAATTNEGSYYLGRPWQNEPRCYFLNTTMNVLPATAGWTSMGTLPTHFYEYNSMNASGTAISLTGRTNSPTSTNSYTPVLTDEEAAKFTLKNVLGGTDSWLPTDYTTVTTAPTISLDGSTISWDAVADARCYVIFKDGEYLTNQTETSYNTNGAVGDYTVRAANEMGGLGDVSNTVSLIALNENDGYTPVAATGVNVVLTRTIKADNWNTIVLPFAMTSAQITSTFGSGTEIAQLSSMDGTTLKFTSVSEMSDNEPYLIKVASDFSSAIVSGVTIVEGTPTKSIAGVDFVGSYNATTDIPYSTTATSYYFLSSNTLYRSSESDSHDTMKGFRAYFKVPGATAARALAFTIENDITGIADVNSKMSDASGHLIDLQGRRVAQPAKGLYIVNGKKVFIK